MALYWIVHERYGVADQAISPTVLVELMKPKSMLLGLLSRSESANIGSSNEPLMFSNHVFCGIGLIVFPNGSGNGLC
jgi:hypothetical protein